MRSVLGLLLQSYSCSFHPDVEAVATCSSCKKPVCQFCMPQMGKRCRACIGYRQARTTSAGVAAMVAIFISTINPVFALIFFLIIFFSFRALFRYRTRVLLRNALRLTTSPRTATNQPVRLRFCSSCNLWTDGQYCKQYGNKLADGTKA